MEKTKKKKNKKKKSGKIWVLLLLVILLILLLFQCHRKSKQSVGMYEENVNAITEIDYSNRQEALDAIVEEGKININYSSKATFKGTVSTSFNLKNIKNNHYPIIFEIFDEEGESIYLSQKIKPGYEMNQIELTKDLSKGIHDCKVKIGYAEDGNVATVFPIQIEVK